VVQRSDCEVLRLRQSVSAMGSTFSIVLYGRDRDGMEASVRAAFDEVRRLDGLLSSYRPESEWSIVNRRAAQQPVAVSPELFRLLSVCLERSHETEGAFDITVGPLKKAWGFHRETGRVPTAEELAAARGHVGHQFVRLDPASQTVRFDHPGVELDPGGIGKGYAVDRMVEILRRHGFDSALVAGSRSSIYGLGAPPAGVRGWRAEISRPGHPGTSVAHVLLNDASLSTSGTGEQCHWSDGKMYSHIVDPRTGSPLQTVAQVSVVTSRALDGEVWAKACLLNGLRWAAEHKPDAFRILFCGEDPAQRRTWL
jgi:thiamine biosynthesis lipoprotein